MADLRIHGLPLDKPATSPQPLDSLRRGNLYSDAHRPAEGERFDTLLRHRNLLIERIVSAEAAPSTEYVQAQDEWVVLLRGEAVLEVAGESHSLVSGDYLFLPSGVPHIVRSASGGALWLAVHLHAPSDG